MKPANSLRMTVYASLMAALIAAGAFLSIPIGPVPIVLQNFFVLLCGLLLGAGLGAASRRGLPSGRGLRAADFCRRDGGDRPYFRAHRRLPARLPAGGGRRRLAVTGIRAPVGRESGRVDRRLPDRLPLRGPLAQTRHRHGLEQGPGTSGMYPFLIGDALKIAAAIPVARGPAAGCLHGRGVSPPTSERPHERGHHRDRKPDPPVCGRQAWAWIGSASASGKGRSS